MSTTTHKTTTIQIFTNPEELRKLADKMEKVYKTTHLGESNYVGTIGHIGNELSVDIHFDQSWFAAQKKK